MDPAVAVAAGHPESLAYQAAILAAEKCLDAAGTAVAYASSLPFVVV